MLTLAALAPGAPAGALVRSLDPGDGGTNVAGAPLDNVGQPTGTRRGSAYTFAATGTPTRRRPRS